jgi:alternate signal-mediated exported protein
MQRLTKAAIATGAAAALLLGGGGTLAYWTGSAQDSAGALNSGTLSVTAGACSNWAYPDGSTVNLIVPGDAVNTTCTVTVQGTGDHLAVTASLAPGTTFTGDAALIAELNNSLTVTDVTDGAGNTLPATGLDLSDGTSHTLQVVVQATFPYGDADTVSTNPTQDEQAVLSALTVNVVQVNPNR